MRLRRNVGPPWRCLWPLYVVYVGCDLRLGGRMRVPALSSLIPVLIPVGSIMLLLLLLLLLLVIVVLVIDGARCVVCAHSLLG